ncbi:MAG: TIGR01777 family protein [Flavobacteriaceae bacterium TMED147]|nr:MAG: TIGR01777 family protein [Flavobacteriaceae bacterium TMED147]
MKILITGATGLLGRSLVKTALSKGIEINFLTTKKSKINCLNKAKGFYWNPSNGDLDTDCFLGVDVIIHLAGASISKLWTSSYKKLIFSSRVDSTRLLFSRLKQIGSRHKIKQIISASAVGIYPSDFEKKFSETAKVYPSTFMEEVVNAWENEVNSFDLINIKVAKMRIGLVLSIYGGVLGPLKIPTSFGLGAAFGDGKQGQSWIHISDVVGVFLKACNEQWEGVFNLVAPNPVSQTDFIKALAKALNRPYFLPPIPKILLKILVGKMSSLVLDSHWVSAQKVIGKKYKFLYPEINSAMKNIIDNS